MNPCVEEECYRNLDNMLLNSYQHLRKIFNDRWKSVTGEEWVDDAEHLGKLLDDLGQTGNRTGLPLEKSGLEGKTVADWDMPVLSLVLQNFPSGVVRQEDEEVTAVQQLKNLRDALAYHDNRKRIPEFEFQANVNILRSSLRDLGVAEQEITNLVVEASLRSLSEGAGSGTREIGNRLPRKLADLLTDSSIERFKKMFDSKKTGVDIRWCAAQLFTWKIMVTIIEKAREGSEAALRILQTFDCAIDLENLLQLEVDYSEDHKLEILDLAYNIALLVHQFVKMSDKLRLKMERIITNLFEERRGKKGDLDMKSRYWILHCLCDDWKTTLSFGHQAPEVPAEALMVLKEGLGHYPDNVHYHVMMVLTLYLNQKFDKANRYGRQGLQRFPGNLELLFWRASALRNLEQYDESTELFQEFLKIAARDNQRTPEVLYEISVNYLAAGNLDEGKIHFHLGRKAEKDQLRCYLSYWVPAQRDAAMMMLRMEVMKLQLAGSPNTKSESSPETKPKPLQESESVLERKKYLNSATRKEIVLEQREHLNKPDPKLNCVLASNPTAVAPKLKQTAPKDLSLLKPITLSQMDRSQDRIFENRILDLTIIDDPNPNYAFITVIAEDENRGVIRVYIYNVDRSKETMDNYRAGCRIAIMNPYIWIGAICGTRVIRANDPKCIVFKGRVENMCRFCGEGGASNMCVRCKRPYCSKECQTLDWNMFNHKLICPIEY